MSKNKKGREVSYAPSADSKNSFVFTYSNDIPLPPQKPEDMETEIKLSIDKKKEKLLEKAAKKAKKNNKSSLTPDSSAEESVEETAAAYSPAEEETEVKAEEKAEEAGLSLAERMDMDADIAQADAEKETEGKGEAADGEDAEKTEEAEGETKEENGIPQPPEKKKKRTAADIIQLSLIAFFALIFLGCAVYLADNIANKIKGNEIYSDALDLFDSSSTTPDRYTSLALSPSDSSLQTLYDRLSSGLSDSDIGKPDGDSDFSSIYETLASLKEANPDIRGWIYAEGTDINYPVVKGPNNDYYLDRSYMGERLAIGSIFIDYRTKEGLTNNYNTVIYGHNVTAGAQSSSMFHDVTKFFEEDTFNNSLIYIYTLDGVYIYKPFSVHQTVYTTDYDKLNFRSENEFLSFAKRLARLSKVKSDYEFKEGDTIITLSTCTNVAQDGRYALHAVLVEIKQ